MNSDALRRTEHRKVWYEREFSYECIAKPEHLGLYCIRGGEICRVGCTSDQYVSCAVNRNGIAGLASCSTPSTTPVRRE